MVIVEARSAQLLRERLVTAGETPTDRKEEQLSVVAGVVELFP